MILMGMSFADRPLSLALSHAGRGEKQRPSAILSPLAGES